MPVLTIFTCYHKHLNSQIRWLIDWNGVKFNKFNQVPWGLLSLSLHEEGVYDLPVLLYLERWWWWRQWNEQRNPIQQCEYSLGKAHCEPNRCSFYCHVSISEKWLLEPVLLQWRNLCPLAVSQLRCNLWMTQATQDKWLPSEFNRLTHSVFARLCTWGEEVSLMETLSRDWNLEAIFKSVLQWMCEFAIHCYLPLCLSKEIHLDTWLGLGKLRLGTSFREKVRAMRRKDKMEKSKKEILLKKRKYLRSAMSSKKKKMSCWWSSPAVAIHYLHPRLLSHVSIGVRNDYSRAPHAG